MEIIQNEKKINSNYKKLIWILIVFNIIFLLAIFGLNYACYSALESKCEDNIQLSTNISKQDKKELNNNGYNAFIDSLNRNNFPYYAVNIDADVSGGDDYDEIYTYLEDEFYFNDNIVLNGYYNFYVYYFCEFACQDFDSLDNIYVGTFRFWYDNYLDNVNTYFNVNLNSNFIDFNVGLNVSGERYQGQFTFIVSSLVNMQTNNLFYDTSNNSNTYSYNLTDYDFSGIDTFYNFKQIVYFVPVGDSSELGNYQTGYDKGYQDGLNDADVYEYAQEYYNNGFNAGYQEGIQKGIEESGNNILGNMLLSIFDVPLMYLSSLLNFNLLGINLLGLLGAILCIGLIAFLIKKLL